MNIYGFWQFILRIEMGSLAFSNPKFASLVSGCGTRYGHFNSQ